ncbi:MAG TPA: TOBE domain-containing protein [Synergistaceae bacterium]|jgi:molybdate transport system regulatory protein|nr:TOBE domain-containing protein [Synergistaceae bacterium]HPX03293.1 TOBE domain-containing protein [Synergistaceae bacterium]HQA54268.1 TOBE domain-containing protein [Synergistaceae bacterium]
MLTSSRNQFKGTVKSIKKGAVNDEIVIKLSGGTELTAIITETSTAALGLKEGAEAIALVKASWVILAADLEGIKLSARNQLRGTVKEVRTGSVNSEVVVTLDSGEELVAIVTCESEKKLGLAVGKKVTALIKASHIIVGVAE